MLPGPAVAPFLVGWAVLVILFRLAKKNNGFAVPCHLRL